MTMTHPQQNPEVAAVLVGHLRVAELVTTPETLAAYYRKYIGLEFSVGHRDGRRLEVTASRKDGSLIAVGRIKRTEPKHVSPDNEGMNDGRRSWECFVSYGQDARTIDGFQTKIECTLAARQWFIANGISPDSPGGWD